MVLVLGLLGLGFVGSTGRAFAAAEAGSTPYQVPVGLLGIDGTGVEPGMGTALTTMLQRQIPKLQSMRVEASNKDLVEVKLVFNCIDENPACMAQIGKRLNVARLIYGSIRRQPPSQGGLYTVAIRQLNVVDATVEQFITEAVAPEILKLDNPQLAEIVERWVHQLLVEGMRGGLHVVSEPSGATVELDGLAVGQTPVNLSEVDVGEHRLKIELAGRSTMKRTIRIKAGLVHEVTATLPESGSGAASLDAPGKGPRWLRIATYVAAGVAGVSALAAVGTWRGYIGDQDTAGSQLTELQSRLGPSGRAAYHSFFSSADQLSSCTAVPGLMADPNYQGYLSSCQHGNTLAGVTTGLWVVAGTAAVVSITAALLSSLRHSPEPADSTAPATPPAPTAPTVAPAAAPAAAALRLRDLSPSVGPGSANLAATFSF